MSLVSCILYLVPGSRALALALAFEVVGRGQKPIKQGPLEGPEAGYATGRLDPCAIVALPL